MSISERLRADGQWDITLSANTPRSIIDQIGMLHHVAVTSAWVRSPERADILDQARFTGVVRDRPGDQADEGYRLAGPSLAWWLKTVAIEPDAIDKSQGFSAWISDLTTQVNDRLSAGTTSTISGTLEHRIWLETVRGAFDFVCDFFDADWRVNAGGTIDAGDDIFVDTPETIVTRLAGGNDPSVRGLPVASLERARDLEGYANRVVVVAQGEGEDTTTGADQTASGDIPYETLKGNTARITRLVDAPNTQEGNEATVAARELSKRSDLRRALTLSTDVYDIGRDVEPGDQLWAYDPDVDLYDTANQVDFRGRTIFPVKLKAYATTWPVRQGMGVYLITPDGVVDLTEWVVFEDGATSVEVGASARRLTSDSGSSRKDLRPGPWQTPTFENGWSDFGGAFQTARFRREAGTVRLDGMIAGGTVSNTKADGTAFTLPTNFRPSSQHALVAETDTAGTSARVDIHTDGAVHIFDGSSTYISLSGLTFPV